MRAQADQTGHGGGWLDDALTIGGYAAGGIVIIGGCIDGPFAAGTCIPALQAGGMVLACTATASCLPGEGGIPETALGATAGGLDEELSAVRSQLANTEKQLSELCSANSFAGATKVLLADGASKPIDRIKVGDKIANALPGVDPGTRDQSHTVTAIHITHTDHDYTNITIATPAGPRTITGTSHHLYWDQCH